MDFRWHSWLLIGHEWLLLALFIVLGLDSLPVKYGILVLQDRWEEQLRELWQKWHLLKDNGLDWLEIVGVNPYCLYK